MEFPFPLLLSTALSSLRSFIFISFFFFYFSRPFRRLALVTHLRGQWRRIIIIIIMTRPGPGKSSALLSLTIQVFIQTYIFLSFLFYIFILRSLFVFLFFTRTSASGPCFALKLSHSNEAYGLEEPIRRRECATPLKGWFRHYRIIL